MSWTTGEKTSSKFQLDADVICSFWQLLCSGIQ